MIHQKRLLSMMSLALCLILCLVLCAPALAADGDNALFESTNNGYNENSAEGAVAIGDTLYISTWQELYTYKLGDAEPTELLKLWEPMVVNEATAEATPAPLESIDGATPAEPVNQWPENYSYPFAYQGKLHMIGYESGKLRVLEGGAMVDTELKINRPEGVSSDNSVVNLLTTLFEFEDKLYALMRVNADDWDAPQELWQVDLASGGHTVIKTEFPVGDVCGYKPGQLVCWTKPAWGTLGDNMSDAEYAAKLFVIDAATGKTVEGPVAMKLGDSWNTPAGLAYDPASGKILYATVNKLMALSGIDAEPELLSYYPRQVNGGRVGSTILAGTHHILPTWDGVYIRNFTAGPPSGRTLRIVNSYLSDAASVFIRENPDILLDFADVEDAYRWDAEELAQKIQTGDVSFDILRMYDTDKLRQLMEKGFTLDLSQSEALQAAYARMYPVIRDAVSVDGKPMAFPSNIWFSMWRYNKQKLEALGLSYPETIADYIELLQRWDELKDDNADVALIDGGSQYSESEKTRMLGMITGTYIEEFSTKDAPLRFNTPEFREAMQALEAMPGEYADNLDTSSDVEYKPSVIMTYSGLENYDSESGVDTFAHPPAIRRADERAMSVSLGVYIVNPNSPNVDLALKFLEHLATRGDPVDMIAMYTDYDEPVPEAWAAQSLKEAEEYLEQLKKEEITEENRRDMEQQIKDAESWRDRMLARQWRVSPESIAQYREFAKTMRVAESNTAFSGKSGEQIVELFKRYTDGQIGLDQLIRELDQKSQMIFLEQQ